MNRASLITPFVQIMERTPPTRTLLRRYRFSKAKRDSERPRVLCVGYRKTGTTSFACAMRTLGFSHYGYDLDLARALQRGDVDQCLRFAERFDSLDDAPWSDPRFVRAFQQRFPGSHYVLLERDDASWVRSYQAYYGLNEPESVSLERLQRHNREILTLLSDEPHVLRMNVCAGDGYDKLCPFLGLPIPSTPFAWANKGTDKHRSHS